MGRKSLVGMEVPFIGSDSVKWVEASVPDTFASASGLRSVAPPTEDCASCSIIGTPPTYLIWYFLYLLSLMSFNILFCILHIGQCPARGINDSWSTPIS